MPEALSSLLIYFSINMLSALVLFIPSSLPVPNPNELADKYVHKGNRNKYFDIRVVEMTHVAISSDNSELMPGDPVWSAGKLYQSLSWEMEDTALAEDAKKCKKLLMKAERGDQGIIICFTSVTGFYLFSFCKSKKSVDTLNSRFKLSNILLLLQIHNSLNIGCRVPLIFKVSAGTCRC